MKVIKFKFETFSWNLKKEHFVVEKNYLFTVSKLRKKMYFIVKNREQLLFCWIF